MPGTQQPLNHYLYFFKSKIRSKTDLHPNYSESVLESPGYSGRDPEVGPFAKTHRPTGLSSYLRNLFWTPWSLQRSRCSLHTASWRPECYSPVPPGRGYGPQGKFSTAWPSCSQKRLTWNPGHVQPRTGSVSRSPAPRAEHPSEPSSVWPRTTGVLAIGWSIARAALPGGAPVVPVVSTPSLPTSCPHGPDEGGPSASSSQNLFLETATSPVQS